MPLQDRIGHLQAEDDLVREDTPFPDTIRVSTPVLEWCVLEAIRPTQIGRQPEQAHWQFFFVPPELRAKTFGFGRTPALDASPQENPGESRPRRTQYGGDRKCHYKGTVGNSVRLHRGAPASYSERLGPDTGKARDQTFKQSPSRARQSFHTSSCERVARLPAARPTELQFLRTRKRASQSQERLAATHMHLHTLSEAHT
jgi:hypothetical protein